MFSMPRLQSSVIVGVIVLLNVTFSPLRYSELKGGFSTVFMRSPIIVVLYSRDRFIAA